MADTPNTQTPSTEKAPRDRSPSFPFIPLKTVVERFVAFEKFFGRHPSPPRKAGLAWRMKEKSSQANQTLAALRSFGLVRYKGSGAERQIELTEEGRTYIRTQQESVKKQILKQGALRPRVIRKYWTSWGGDRPPNAVALDQLYDAGFSDAGAAKFLKVYDDTIAYAGLSDSDKIPDEDTENGEDESEDDGIGDNHEQHTRANQLHRTKRKERPGMKEDVFTLKEGDVVLQWPESLSGESFEDLEAWTKLILRKIRRHIILNEPVVGSMSTEYTDDEDGRQKEERDRKLNEEINGGE